jgi:hypothetical protein
MKHILIPTTYGTDTVDAMRVASNLAIAGECEITLLSISPLPDSITDLLFITKPEHLALDKHDALMRDWQTIQQHHAVRTTVNEHHRFGITEPVFKQILQRLSVDMVVIPPSFQQSTEFAHTLFIRLLRKSNCPAMLLPQRKDAPEHLRRALFIDAGNYPGDTLESLPFHIIHQSMIRPTEHLSLRQIVENHQIDVIVHGKTTPRAEEEISKLGLPVLAV